MQCILRMRVRFKVDFPPKFRPHKVGRIALAGS